MRGPNGFRHAQPEIRDQVDRRDVASELGYPHRQLARDVDLVEHREGHVDRRGTILGSAGWAPKLVVRAKRLDELSR
jgi:hypothetical protein